MRTYAKSRRASPSSKNTKKEKIKNTDDIIRTEYFALYGKNDKN
ncbi:hypothetical protein [Metabacillus litoralis]|nr:hypothetical protein [Metabacillus litoralis]